MKHRTLRLTLLSLIGGALLTACSQAPSEPRPKTPSGQVAPSRPLGRDRYVVMTYERTLIPAGPYQGQYLHQSYITYYDQLPKGTGLTNRVEDNTLTGRFGTDGGGLLQAGQQLYRYSNSFNNHTQGALLVNTPVRLVFSPTGGQIGEQVYQDTDNVNFSQTPKNIFVTDRVGYLVEPPSPGIKELGRYYTIDTFDPILMQPLQGNLYITNTDIEQINAFTEQVTPALKGQSLSYTALGLNLLVRHGDVLLLDVQRGGEAGVSATKDIYLAAYEATNGGRYLGASALKGTGRIGSASELLQYCHDEQGDLYLLAQGGDALGFYRNSMIYRVRKGQYEIDPTWQVKVSDLFPDRGAIRFNGIFARGGKVYTMVSVGDLKTEDDQSRHNLWQHYSIDVATRSAEPIPGLLPSSSFVHGVNNVAYIDGKIYLRYVRLGDEQPYNGYYLYDPEARRATPAFSFEPRRGGLIADFKKITLPR